MEKITLLLEGKKTYLQVTVALVILVAYLAGLIEWSVAAPVLVALGFGSIAALHAKK